MLQKPRLSLRLTPMTAYAVLTATGSIDSTTQNLLDEHLARALGLTRTAVIVDLTEVDSCDRNGLVAVARTARLAGTRGPALIVVTPDPKMQRMLIAYCSRPLHTHPDLASAVSWLETGIPQPVRIPPAREGDGHPPPPDAHTDDTP